MCLHTEALKGRDPLRIKVCIGPWGLNVVGPKVPGRCPGLSDLSRSPASLRFAPTFGLDAFAAGIFSTGPAPLFTPLIGDATLFNSVVTCQREFKQPLLLLRAAADVI